MSLWTAGERSGEGRGCRVGVVGAAWAGGRGLRVAGWHFRGVVKSGSWRLDGVLAGSTTRIGIGGALVRQFRPQRGGGCGRTSRLQQSRGHGKVASRTERLSGQQ